MGGFVRERQLRDEAHRTRLEADAAIVEARNERDNAVVELEVATLAAKREVQLLLTILEDSNHQDD